MNRRTALKTLGTLPVTAMLSTTDLLPSSRSQNAPAADKGMVRQSGKPLQPTQAVLNHPTNFDSKAVAFLEEIRLRGSHYFFECADPETGLVYDRTAVASPRRDATQEAVASISATGFGLSALCTAALHKYLPVDQCTERLEKTLKFLHASAPHERGFFPHFLDAKTGMRAWKSEISSIDTAIVLYGAIHARTFLNTAQADKLVKDLLERVDWQWMQNRDHSSMGSLATLSMGWTPESGFLPSRWDSVSECFLMYLLAIASPTHGLPAGVWDQIQRNIYDYGGIRFISSYGALFIHQYPHLWLDLRNQRDRYVDVCWNGAQATRAHKAWCMMQHDRFPWVDERVWGFSASDTPDGSYTAWGAPPEVGNWDGTLAPHAAGGSLTLLPEECMVALTAMREHHPRSFGRYGFVDAFNPGKSGGTGWFDEDVVAIDIGLTMLMAENQQTGSVMRSTSSCQEIKTALREVGFTHLNANEMHEER